MKNVDSKIPPYLASPFWFFFIGIAITSLWGCGGQGGKSQSTSPPPQAVVITTQPASQTILIGRTATFSVAASGTGPLQYQWSKNGEAISGATSATYTTPVVGLGDGGEAFQVTVTNAVNSVSSATATLTAGPRGPAVGDLRYLLFEQVSAAGFYQDGGEVTNITGSSSFWADNAIGTTLRIGTFYACYVGVPFDCAYGFEVFDLPNGQTGLSMNYESHDYPSFSSDIQSIAAPNVVIDSLDFETEDDDYAVSFVKTAQTGGFDYRLEVVAPVELQTTVANDGAESRIVTAVSFDANNQANLISYGWTGDTTTVYEAQTFIAASASEIVSQAETLAANGYFISAFGGSDADGYMLIGMRVQGDTMPRPIYVTTANPSGSSSANTLPQQDPPYDSEVIAGGIFGGFTIAPSQVYISEE